MPISFLPDEGHDLIRDAIDLGTRHPHYDRVCQLRQDYLTCLTGKGYERFLTQFLRREDDKEYKQRLDLTHQNLSSVTSPLIKKYGQISRIQDIKKGLEFNATSERDQRDLQAILDQFGAKGSARRGSLDDFLTLHYDLTSLYDPNAFIVLDFEPFNANLGQRATPYALVYDCTEVLNFRFSFGFMDFVLVQVKVVFRDKDKRQRTVTDLILYSGPFSIRYFAEAEGRTDLPDTFDTRAADRWKAASGTIYRMAQYAPLVEETPAVRLGYLTDPETSDETCISPLFHAALDQFRELINLKSKNDLINWLHCFPRRYEFAPVCPGEVDPTTKIAKGCREGKTMGGQECSRCKGTGFLTHTSEQDFVRIPLKQSVDPKEMFKLSELSFTEKPDIVSIERFDAKIKDLQTEIYKTIFNTDFQVKTTGQVAVAKTATEVSVTSSDINNTLLPFADDKSYKYKTLVGHIAALMSISGQVSALYEFPRDLRLASAEEIYAEIERAEKSGVSDIIIEQLNDDAARKKFESDPSALRRYFVKKQHTPFFNLSLAKFEYYDSTGRIAPEDAIRRVYCDTIFGELEMEVAGFYDLAYAAREALIVPKVTAVLDRLPKAVNFSDQLRRLNSADPEEEEEEAA